MISKVVQNLSMPEGKSSSKINGVLAIGTVALLGWIGWMRIRNNRKLYAISESYGEGFEKYSAVDYIKETQNNNINNNSTKTPLLSALRKNLIKLCFEKYKFKQVLIKKERAGKFLRGWHFYCENKQITISTQKNESCSLIQLGNKIRKSNRIILFLQSQHTRIEDNFEQIKNLMSSTLSDVIIFDYVSNSQKPLSLWHSLTGIEASIKNNAAFIMKKVLEIAQNQQKDVFIMGKGLGSSLAIYLSKLFQTSQLSYKIKGIILEDMFRSYPELLLQTYDSIIYSSSISKLIVADRWQSKKLIEQLNIPIMLIIREIQPKSQQQSNQKSETSTSPASSIPRKIKQCPNAQMIGHNALTYPLQESVKLYSYYKGRKVLTKVKQVYKVNKWIADSVEFYLDIDIFMSRLA